MCRADLFLRQAQGVLQTYANFPSRRDERDAWSCTYLPLTKLLGHDLSVALRAGGELQRDYVYCGDAFDTKGPSREEHVVPLKCIIEHLLAAPEEWRGRAGRARLRTFMAEHLVLAKVPLTLERELAPQTMADARWCHPASTISELVKHRAMWCRYRVVPGLRLPWQRGSHFRVRTAED